MRIVMMIFFAALALDMFSKVMLHYIDPHLATMLFLPLCILLRLISLLILRFLFFFLSLLIIFEYIVS
jgi:hypothetical protein